MSQFGTFNPGTGAPPIETITGNSGGAVGPDSSGNLNLIGAGNITVSGTPATNTETITLIGTTTHAVQVGNSSGSLTSLSVATNGQLLVGATTADPSFVTPTVGTGLTLTTNSTTLSYALTVPVAIANGGTNATTMATTDGTVYFDGTRLVTTTTGSSGQVLTSAGPGVAPSYQSITTFSWSEVTTTSQAMAVNTGYVANNAGLVTLTLPTTAALGDILRVGGKGAGGWKIAQNSGQVIHFDGSDTTTGVGGSLASTVRYDAIEIVCITTNSDFLVVSGVGNFTVV